MANVGFICFVEVVLCGVRSGSDLEGRRLFLDGVFVGIRFTELGGFV